MFSATLAVNSTGSCGTIAMARRSSASRSRGY
jgi:hypothetical protein